MSYLFDRAVRYDPETKSQAPVAEGHAIYVLSKPACEAAYSIFSEMKADQLVRFLFLPFPRICIEWMSDAFRTCAVLEETTATHPDTGETYEAVNVALVVEPLGLTDTEAYKQQGQCSLFYVRTVSQGGNIPWYTTPAAEEIPKERRMSDDEQRVFLTHVLMLLGLINQPQLRRAEPRDLAKVNKARIKTGKTPLSNHTIISPTRETSEWMRDQRAPERGQSREHWVKGHFHTYWTGPRTSEQKPLIKLLAPHKRGNPERGEKPQRYVVT